MRIIRVPTGAPAGINKQAEAASQLTFYRNLLDEKSKQAVIGLNTNVIKLVKNGANPILLGLICWIILSGASLGIQHLLSI